MLRGFRGIVRLCGGSGMGVIIFIFFVISRFVCSVQLICIVVTETNS